MNQFLRKLIVFLVILFAVNLQAQDKKEITFTAVNEPILDILSEIEAQFNVQFYVIEDWIKDQKTSVVKDTYTLEALLKEVLDDTPLNFYKYSEDKVVLVKNNSIVSELPKGFVVDSLKRNNTQANPIFAEEFNQDVTDGNIITIGKRSSARVGSEYELTGYIRDSKTNAGIDNLVISANDKSIYTTTDANGFYTLRLPAGQHRVETSGLGYGLKSKTIVLYGSGSLNFNLVEDAQLLKEVIIESNKSENIREATVGISRINLKEIKTIPLVLGERDVLKVAVTLPGIQKAGEGSIGYNVRGGRADQNLILLDDAVIYSPSHFLGFFSGINPFTTGSVDIYKGNIPAEFGGRLSSVFDIETKAGNKEKISGEGSIGPVTGNLTLEVPVVKDRSSILVGGRATYSGWILRSLSEESLKDSEASFYDGIINYNDKINDKHQVKASVYYSDDKFSITSDSLYRYNNALASVNYTHQWNDKKKGELILSHSNYQFEIDFDANSDKDFLFDYTINESQLKYNLNHKIDPKHNLLYGGAAKYYNIDPGNIEGKGESSTIQPLSIQSERAVESAIFLSDEYEVNKKLQLNLGLRYSHYANLGPSVQREYQDGAPKNESTVVSENTYDDNEVVETYGGLEYRFSGRYFLTPELSLKAGYNRTLQYIHLLSSNTTISPTDTYKLSDLNIKPQKASQFSLGVFRNFDDQDLEVSLEGYYKSLDDILDYKTGANLTLNENIETELLQGEGQAYGVEFLLKKKKGNLNGYFGYTYSRTFIKLDSENPDERVNNGEYFPANYDKPHDFSLVANYKITQRYSVSFNASYQTGRPITYPVGKFEFAGEEQVVYSDRNDFRIPDYFRLDIGFNIEGNHKKMKLAHSFWNISIYNVLGRNNPYSVYFVNDNKEIKAYQTSIFSVPVPTITYNFKF